MSLFDGIRRLFGEGKIRVEGQLTNGRKFNCKINYTGDPTTLDKGELFETVRTRMLVEHGVKVDMKSLHIVGITQ